MILSFLLLDSTDVRFSFWVAEKASEPRAFITRKPAVLLDKHGRSPAKGLEWGGGGGITQVYCHPQRHRHDYFYLFTVLLPRFDCELPEGRNTFHSVNSLTRLRLLGCWKGRPPRSANCKWQKSVCTCSSSCSSEEHFVWYSKQYIWDISFWKMSRFKWGLSLGSRSEGQDGEGAPLTRLCPLEKVYIYPPAPLHLGESQSSDLDLWA